LQNPSLAVPGPARGLREKDPLLWRDGGLLWPLLNRGGSGGCRVSTRYFHCLRAAFQLHGGARQRTNRCSGGDLASGDPYVDDCLQATDS
jgi:hypothetical protein